jgi:hypothetical protein
MTSILTAAALLASAGGLLESDTPNERHIGADASFIVHVDLEHAVETTLGGLALEMLHESGEAEMLDQITSDLGIEIGRDVHAVTIYGEEDEPVILIYGSDELERWDEFLAEQQAEGRVGRIGGHRVREIGPGEDGGGGIGAMVETGGGIVWVVAEGRADLEDALEVIDGDSDSVDLDEWPIAGPARGALVYIGVKDFDSISDWSPASDIAQRAAGVSVCIGESDGDAFLHAQLTANDEDEASTIVQVVEGLLGMGKLIAIENPEVGAILDFVGDIDLESDGDTISLAIEHDVDTVIEFMESIDR